MGASLASLSRRLLVLTALPANYIQERDEAYLAAWQLGRYALDLLVGEAAHFVHEIGHLYDAESEETWTWPPQGTK